mmetsp:Transcript_25442/g.44283  ORF Transcript_25442/g.44283 Transcript_25442/m.44283 type:complete len:221 (+) Transcript_25442:148-810(+)|eukprot:CAMPEP_0204911516 /NCGR_PEP_ID=MMETSP1397-20131031/9847_1 /ASSEMBLY_ACC=CAM_ASM_000891 /TAXON_ID=49980 /ORGANISM="Climacostomum Climacostomum virens, Strain Stock W-24" /LENGTH=220 /DNA_ID=CAMNT_0052082097 /DNA_START=95 /DNA_END=757 /DNA_ORIENTATION=-
MKKPKVSKTAKKSAGRTVPPQFTNATFRGIVYSLGSVAYIKELNDDVCFGTIESFQQAKDSSLQVKIRWFYKPSDVFPEPNPCFSKRELFDSDHRQIISAESLNGLAKIINFEEFFTVDIIDSDTYFSRALYQASKKTLSPPLETWPRACVCERILNPDDVYMKCLACGRAFHYSCMVHKLADDVAWLCLHCYSTDMIKYDYELLEENPIEEPSTQPTQP